VLLAVSVLFLIPNSQDTSAFYLANIYQLLADSNVTRTATLSPIAKPPPFSPRDTLWVNSLWFLSLLISLTCALLALSTQQWARRYIRVTQPAGCSPEKRARMRALFVNGLNILPHDWVVEALPTLLYLSLFLFFAGLAIFLFNINKTVFSSVFWWIGLFSIIYALITLMPLVRHNSPYYSPLSLLAWFLYTSISLLFLTVIFPMLPNRLLYFSRISRRLWRLRDRYRGRFTGGVEKAAEEMLSKRSSIIDVKILAWMIDAFANDDYQMKDFLQVIPGFLNSNMVEVSGSELPYSLLKRLCEAWNGFFVRTLQLNSDYDYERSPRLKAGMSAMRVIGDPRVSSILNDILAEPWDQAPQDIEICDTMAPWRSSDNKVIAQYSQCMATRIIASVKEYDERWIALATDVLSLSDPKLRRYSANGNNSVSLSILISVARRNFHSDFHDLGLLSTLCRLDIRNTLPELQHDFCMLWNECVEETRRQPDHPFFHDFLRFTRTLYIHLHQGTPAAPTRFSDSTPSILFILYGLESCPMCTIPDPRPDPTISDSRAEIGESSQGPLTSSPALPSNSVTGNPIAHPLGGSRLSGLDSAPQDKTSTVTSFYHSGGNKQEDILTSWVLTDTGRISFTKSAFFLAPAPAAPVLNKLSTSYDESSPKYSPPASSIIPAPPPLHMPPMRNANFLSLGCTSSSNSLDNTTPMQFCARGLINEGNTCFVNAALQLLVYCPLFWDQLRDIGRLMGQHGQGEVQPTCGPTTLLMDSTIRLLNEFLYKEKPLLTQQSLQLANRRRARKDGRRNKDDDTDPFLPTYVYEAMKEKRQLRRMLVRTCAYVARLCYRSVLTYYCIFTRTAGNKMQKSFSMPILTRSTKSLSDYLVL
jgi:Family of unknown function (DUF6535)